MVSAQVIRNVLAMVLVRVQPEAGVAGKCSAECARAARIDGRESDGGA